MLFRNIVEKSSQENLKIIKYTFPEKSGNPGSLKKFESFSTNILILAEVSTGCFIYGFVIQIISEKPLYSKGFASNVGDVFT